MLDENTDLSKKRSAIWDCMFQGLKDYTIQETQKVLQLDEKGANSSSAINSRQRRKRVRVQIPGAPLTYFNDGEGGGSE